MADLPTSYMRLRGKPLIWVMISTVIFPAYFTLGYNNAVFGGLLDLDSFLTTFPNTDTVNTTGAKQTENSRIQGTVVAIYLVGCLLGSLSCLQLGDKLGRIRILQVGATISIIGTVLQDSSFSLPQLMIGRITMGFGFGVIGSTAPVWQAECSPAGHRGSLVVLEAAFATVGLAMSQWIDLGLFFTKTSVAWRFPLSIPILSALIVLISVTFLPDSPRWLVKKGRVTEATAVMSVLEALPTDSPIVAEDIRAMQRSLEEMSSESWKSIMRSDTDKIKLRVFLACFSTFSQQMNGIGVVGFYTVPIFLELGLSSIDARILASALYMWQLPWSIACFWLVDRIGRRKVMIIGSAGIGCSFVVLAGTISALATSKASQIVAAMAVFVIASFFGVSYGVNWLYPTEVAPLAYRTSIYALTIATQFGINFMVVEITPLGIAHLGYKFFIVWAVTNLCVNLPVVYWFFPETTGHTLEDMDAIFKAATGPSDIVKVSHQMKTQRAKDGFEKKEDKAKLNDGDNHSAITKDQIEHTIHIEGV